MIVVSGVGNVSAELFPFESGGKLWLGIQRLFFFTVKFSAFFPGRGFVFIVFRVLWSCVVFAVVCAMCKVRVGENSLR